MNDTSAVEMQAQQLLPITFNSDAYYQAPKEKKFEVFCASFPNQVRDRAFVGWTGPSVENGSEITFDSTQWAAWARAPENTDVEGKKNYAAGVAKAATKISFRVTVPNAGTIKIDDLQRLLNERGEYMSKLVIDAARKEGTETPAEIIYENFADLFPAEESEVASADALTDDELAEVPRILKTFTAAHAASPAHLEFYTALFNVRTSKRKNKETQKEEIVVLYSARTKKTELWNKYFGVGQPATVEAYYNGFKKAIAKFVSVHSGGPDEAIATKMVAATDAGLLGAYNEFKAKIESDAARQSDIMSLG